MQNHGISLLNTPDTRFPIGIVCLKGTEKLGEKIEDYLLKTAKKTFDDNKRKNLSFARGYNNESPELQIRESTLIDVDCPRFSTGDAKGLIKQSVRGYDLYILCDVGNYSITYDMFGQKTCMSPDDHFQDLKRTILAIGGKASRITVIMPILYGGRQHRRNSRESLDAAQALRELENMGVSGIITFDAHDPRVQNAVPLMGFDNARPAYQILKALLYRFNDINLNPDHMMVVSPDEGAMDRNIYYASVLELEMGMFYKRRDYSRIVNGSNPIVEHTYIGESVEGKDIIVSDDILASGDSMIDLVHDLKDRGCRRLFLCPTYALFTRGYDRFDKAYSEGLFDAIVSTNLTYQPPELLARPWHVSADCSKYISYFISTMHQSCSINTVIEPQKKIKSLVEEYYSHTGHFDPTKRK